MSLKVVLLAGGEGKRLWPASTKKMPKQFLKLLSNKSMIQITYERIIELTDKKNVYVSINSNYISILKQQLPDLDNRNIITEPIKKNTFFAIIYSSIIVSRNNNENDNILFVPCDHYFEDWISFQKKINLGDNIIKSKNEKIFLLGIVPNAPEIRYGYIKYAKNKKSNVYDVTNFKEKPNTNLAKEYLRSNQYLWNCGIFLFNLNYFTNYIYVNHNREYLSICSYIKSRNLSLLDQVTNLPFDKMILEKYNDCIVAKYNKLWLDLGSWKALTKILNHDSNNNILFGNVICEDSRNNFFYNDAKEPLIIKSIQSSYVIKANSYVLIGNLKNIDEVGAYD